MCKVDIILILINGRPFALLSRVVCQRVCGRQIRSVWSLGLERGGGSWPEIFICLLNEERQVT